MGLRDYQQEAKNAALEYINSPLKKTPGVIVAPTASGKSWIIAGIATEYVGPILVLQPSIELLEQNYEKFKMMGGEASIFSAGAGSKEIGHVTYATLGSIKNHASLFREAGVKLVLIDECHDKYKPDAGSMFRNFIDTLKPKKVIGLTATPFRLKNNSMGSRLVLLNRMRPGYFRHFIHITQIQDIVNRGYWSPSVDETWDMEDDMLKFNSTGSEFTEESIKAYVEANGINNMIYLRILDAIFEGRKHILVFVDSAQSCQTFVEHLDKVKGIKSTYLTSKTKKKERKAIISGFKSGDIEVVFNYNILTTGFDFPELDCIIMGRPTNSLAIFYQIYGRGTRIHEDKKDFLFADYGCNFTRLGHPRDLVLENYPNHGWAIFASDRLVTGTILGMDSITKNDIDNGPGIDVKEVIEDTFFKYGKFEGQKAIVVARINPQYIIWFCNNVDTSELFKSKLRAILKYTQMGEPELS
jgi:DNA repair protein RadD